VAGAGEEQDPIERLGRLGARLILQQALADEVTEFLGRERYERAGEAVSHRNGYEPRTANRADGTPALDAVHRRGRGQTASELRQCSQRTWLTNARSPEAAVMSAASKATYSPIVPLCRGRLTSDVSSSPA